MALRVTLPFSHPYAIRELERIERLGGRPVFAYPGARAVDPQQELTASPIVLVEPAAGDPWIGVFGGGIWPYAPPQLVGWPDERSFCVIRDGVGDVVRADDPHATYAIDAVYAIKQTVVAHEHEAVLFADDITIARYGADGELWRSERLAWDDLRIDRVEDGTIIASGFDAPEDRERTFQVDLATGAATGAPWLEP